MTTTPTPSPDTAPGRDLTLYCAAACDLNHAAVPHPPWDCNAPDDAPTLTAAQRATIPDGELPWVRQATPLVLSAGEPGAGGQRECSAGDGVPAALRPALPARRPLHREAREFRITDGAVAGQRR